MSLKFIDIAQKSNNDVDPRQGSTFIIRPQWLEILGVLHHGQHWRPRTERDRDELVTWLQNLELFGGL